MNKNKKKPKVLVKVIKAIKEFDKGEHEKTNRFQENQWKF